MRSSRAFWAAGIAFCRAHSPAKGFALFLGSGTQTLTRGQEKAPICGAFLRWGTAVMFSTPVLERCFGPDWGG
jgi:hypothetical protein